MTARMLLDLLTTARPVAAAAMRATGVATTGATGTRYTGRRCKHRGTVGIRKDGGAPTAAAANAGSSSGRAVPWSRTALPHTSVAQVTRTRTATGADRRWRISCCC